MPDPHPREALSTRMPTGWGHPAPKERIWAGPQILSTVILPQGLADKKSTTNAFFPIARSLPKKSRLKIKESECKIFVNEL